MKYITSVAILFGLIQFFGCAGSQSPDETRLAGGILIGEAIDRTTPLGQQIVMIALNYEYRDKQPSFFGICTGFAVNSKTILTAAHCLDGGIENLKILTSSNPREKLRKKKDVYTAIGKTIHEDYIPKNKMDEILKTLKTATEKSNALTSNADVALIYLDRPLENYPVQTSVHVGLPTSGTNSTTAQLIITGFGRSSALADTTQIKFEELNGILKKATVTVPTQSLRHEGFYLEQWEAPGICYGDSGGPVFMYDSENNLNLAAMAINVFETNSKAERKLDPTSQYNACASHGVYLNLAPFKKWIYENLEIF